MLADIWMGVAGKMAQTFDECINVDHKGLGLSGDELVDASQGTDTDSHDGGLEVGDDLGDHEVERSLSVDLHVELIAGILTNLGQGLE
jgi:hypothetical protein